MKVTAKIVLIGLGSAVLGMGTALADEHEANSDDKLGEMDATAKATEQMHLATELATYGRESQNAMALIVAAEMLAQSGAEDVQREKTTEGPDEPVEDKERGEDMFTVSAILSDARDLARGDEALLAAIEQVESQESKGVVCTGGRSCPARHKDVVNPQKSDIYRATFKGGQTAIVAIKGDGDTDLDLRVYDQNGNLICKDTRSTDEGICKWKPIWTGTFVIKVSNLGRVQNYYRLATN
jgi:hypothetical protein